MKMIKSLVAVIATAGIVSVAVIAHAADSKDDVKTERHQGPHGWGDDDQDDVKHSYKERRRPPFDDILNLTAEQKKTLQAARAAQEPTFKESRQKLRAAHEALDKAGDENGDDALLAKLSNDLAILIAQQEVTRIKLHRQFLAILTPEQQQKLAAFEAEHKGSRPGPGEGPWKNKQKSDTTTK
ncbi:MAG: hypothetical protein EOO53_08370 [Gammaproteobacteria bacterium]|nr:MAG: hypothetical protein EOO53_08370 [Gammaproteobacteria bacterium]